ncbi:hypothetical protein G9C98_006237 [Cotesia typhae]|uniref:Uncharacterized protein n=1 Tax=Cotesia typhae TaxID=2053667 RepID=A0A8J5RCK1_9HYME|nr:hypothetical protein G9C98_006237 [Cotesia typhae]
MELMKSLLEKFLLSLLVTSVLTVTFEDTSTESKHGKVNFEINDFRESQTNSNNTRQGKNLFDWIGFGTGQHVDPYIAKMNENCLGGDFAECFKSRAINSLSEFFQQHEYYLNDNVRVVRMGRDLVQKVNRQPFEYTSSPRSDDSEWDQLVKFVERKAEKFLKTVAIEVKIPSSETARNRLKKLLIPMLIILKLFKLKLLLFLPLILGLASFKKFLGFLAIVIPGVIAFFKFCKPLMNNYQPPVYSQSGIGFPHYKDSSSSGYSEDHYHEPSYHNYQPDANSYGSNLAYSGYKPY